MADCALQYGSDWIVPMHPDENAILERLETTKRYGLVSDYLVSWTGRAGRLKAKVTVWRNNGASGYVVQDYIARLLRGLVPGGQISVAD
jgi:hypothetical protein